MLCWSSSMQEVSIIISARNEFPNLPHTINSIMIDCAQAGIEYEFIVADNGSTDETTRFFTHAWADSYAKNSSAQHIRELRPSIRGMVNEGLLRFCSDPVLSNVGARHKAVKYARYENIIFCDGHISVAQNTIKYALETLNKYGGIVHAPVAWAGASIKRPKPGMQYSYKIGEKVWGTWNFAQSSSDQPFYIPVSGHCFLMVKKSTYLDLGGYDTNQRVYGGGENYLDTLFWLLGSNVMVDPRCLVFHLSAGRKYTWTSDGLIHNMILTAYTLGGYKWAERIYVTYLDKQGTDIEMLDKLYQEAISEGQEKRDMIAKRKIMSLEELLGIVGEPDCDGHCYKNQKHKMRKWDIMNEKLHGRHISFVTVFEDWLERLKSQRARDFIKNSPHQK